MAFNPALERSMQEDQEFKVSPFYIRKFKANLSYMRPYLKEMKKN